jgi:hypothetical protein
LVLIEVCSLHYFLGLESGTVRGFMSVSGGTDGAKNRNRRYAAQHSICYKSSIFPWAARRHLRAVAATFHRLRITQECLILMHRCYQRREMKSRKKVRRYNEILRVT